MPKTTSDLDLDEDFVPKGPKGKFGGSGFVWTGKKAMKIGDFAKFIGKGGSKSSMTQRIRRALLRDPNPSYRLIARQLRTNIARVVRIAKKLENMVVVMTLNPRQAAATIRENDF